MANINRPVTNWIINHYSAGVDFRRQNLGSVNVKFWACHIPSIRSQSFIVKFTFNSLARINFVDSSVHSEPICITFAATRQSFKRYFRN